MAFFSGCKPLDICFIIDTSAAVSPDDAESIQYYLQRSIESLNIGWDQSRVGIVSFGSFALTAVALGKHLDKSSVRYAVWNELSFVGSSRRTDMALQVAANDCFGGPGDRPDVDNLAILVVNGISQVSPLPSAAVLRSVAKLVAVGVEDAYTDIGELLAITTSLDYVVTRPLYSALSEAVAEIMQAACGKISVNNKIARVVIIIILN